MPHAFPLAPITERMRTMAYEELWHHKPMGMTTWWVKVVDPDSFVMPTSCIPDSHVIDELSTVRIVDTYWIRTPQGRWECQNPVI